MKNPIIPGIIVVQLLMLGIILSLGAKSNQAANQTDDTSANPTKSCQKAAPQDCPHPPRHAGRQAHEQAISTALGVTTDALREAHRQLPHRKPGHMLTEAQRDENHQALAKALNVDAQKVAQALEDNRPHRRHMPPPPSAMDDPDHGRPVEAVAKELGVTAEQFREAFKLVTPAKRGEEPTETQKQNNRKVLSEALGVDPDKLDAVMDKYRPEGPNQRPPRHDGQPAH